MKVKIVDGNYVVKRCNFIYVFLTCKIKFKVLSLQSQNIIHSPTIEAYRVCRSPRYISTNNAFKACNLVEGIHTLKYKPFSVTLFASVYIPDINGKLEKNFLGLYMLPKNKKLL